MHRKLKRFELRQLWRRDPRLVITRYREIISHDGRREHEATRSPSEMIDAIIEHEDVQFTTTRLLRSIAA